MIPRVIHYCWFGGNPLPELAEKCIESWRRHCPDYEIVRWDETNFDISENNYCRQAYEAKKWAFVSDYARLKVLYDHGGIYMDTDVEVLKGLDKFLEYTAFSGFENAAQIPTGIMASQKGGKWIESLLDLYNNKDFILPDGSMDMTTNVRIITARTLEKYPLKLDNTFQYLNDEVALFPSDYFCPKDYNTGELVITDNTCAIHHFDGSWIPESIRWRTAFIKKYKKIFGKKGARYLSLILYSIKSKSLAEIFRKMK